jgi:hypothetical protein
MGSLDRKGYSRFSPSVSGRDSGPCWGVSTAHDAVAGNTFVGPSAGPTGLTYVPPTRASFCSGAPPYPAGGNTSALWSGGEGPPGGR